MDGEMIVYVQLDWLTIPLSKVNIGSQKNIPLIEVGSRRWIKRIASIE